MTNTPYINYILTMDNPGESIRDYQLDSSGSALGVVPSYPIKILKDPIPWIEPGVISQDQEQAISNDLTISVSLEPRLAKLLRYLGISLAVLALIFGLFTFAPQIINRLNPALAEQITQRIKNTAISADQAAQPALEPEVVYQPTFNPTLPTQNQIIIESIGVDTTIRENTIDNVEDTLRQGVWRVPDFGTPFARSRPTILAAHRFGYKAWTNQYRRENSFFNLPKVNVGDRIEIIWDQRRYVYEVYAEDETNQITDYSADLILYTCKFLQSEDRIFQYARLIEV